MPCCKFPLPPLLIVALLFSLIRPALAGDPKPLPQLKRRPPMNQSQADNRSYVTLKVTTNLVVLDVVATDKKGKAITDLKQGDFTLLEDNKEQKISIFQLQQPEDTDLLHFVIFEQREIDRKSTRLNSSHLGISYAV